MDASGLTSHCRRMVQTLHSCPTCPTRGFCLARDLSPGGLELLGHYLPNPRRVQRGDFIYRHGDATEAAHVLRSGAVKTLLTTPSGEEHITALHFAGELFGLSGLTTGRCAESAMAADTTTFCTVKSCDLPRLWDLGCGPGFLRLAGERDASAIHNRIRLSETRAAARWASFLLERARRQEALGQCAQTLYLPFSRTDLSNYLGMTLESLSRLTSRLARAEVIRMEHNHVVLLRPGELATLCSDLG